MRQHVPQVARLHAGTSVGALEGMQSHEPPRLVQLISSHSHIVYWSVGQPMSAQQTEFLCVVTSHVVPFVPKLLSQLQS